MADEFVIFHYTDVCLSFRALPETTFLEARGEIDRRFDVLEMLVDLKG
jgi:hypothetical protein